MANSDLQTSGEISNIIYENGKITSLKSKVLKVGNCIPEMGDYVIIKKQSNNDENGLYRVRRNNDTTKPYVLVNVDKEKERKKLCDMVICDTLKSETPKSETPKCETPKCEAAIDIPKSETPKSDIPKCGAALETPKCETPKCETPKSDIPKCGAALETPKCETPKCEAAIDIPKCEAAINTPKCDTKDYCGAGGVKTCEAKKPDCDVKEMVLQKKKEYSSEELEKELQEEETRLNKKKQLIDMQKEKELLKSSSGTVKKINKNRHKPKWDSLVSHNSLSNFYTAIGLTPVDDTEKCLVIFDDDVKIRKIGKYNIIVQPNEQSQKFILNINGTNCNSFTGYLRPSAIIKIYYSLSHTQNVGCNLVVKQL
jgi:hypothetical protein